MKQSIISNKDGIFSINMNALKNKRQKLVVQNAIAKNNFSIALRYIESINGVAQSIAGYELRSFKKSEKPLTREEKYGQSGKYLKLQDNLMSYSSTFRPTSKKHNNYFGVEIECFIPTLQNEDGEYLSRWDLERAINKTMKARKITRVSMKSDGSIRPDNNYEAFEFTVLTRFDDTTNLEKLCQVLNEYGTKVNKSCGLHVHLDARNFDGWQVKKIGANFRKTLPLLAGMVPQSRRSNGYCQMSVSRLNGTRYHAINLTAFNKYKTIEVRLHSGTTDFKKIMQWASLLKAIKEADSIKKICKDVNDLTDYVYLPESLIEYIGQRTELFSTGPIAVNDSVIDHDESAA